MKSKQSRIEFRVEPSLKRSFESAAKFNHQTLSQFLVQAGLAAVEAARERGCTIKSPAKPKDGRFKKQR